jgi:hypothetical protein
LKGNFMLSRLLKSVVAVTFVLGASIALAIPTPKDIEAAVAAGHYSQAENMLREVLQDKPQSAKAHYELGQVLAHEHRYKEAQTELEKAKDIDPSLKFAASPDKFNIVYAKVNDLAAAPKSSLVMDQSVPSGINGGGRAVPEAAVTGSGFSLSYAWLAIGGLVLLGLWLRKLAANKSSGTNDAPLATPMGMPSAPRGFGAQFTPNPSQGGFTPQGYVQPNSGGSTMTGALVGGLAGVAAGYALSKTLEGDHHTAQTAGAQTSTDNGYVPFDTPTQPDLGSFDAGSGSDWDSADSSSSSDDSW